MAAKVMLTLDDELHASIERMAEIQGPSKGDTDQGPIEGQKPVIDAMIKTFEEVAAGKDKEKALQEFWLQVWNLQLVKLERIKQ